MSANNWLKSFASLTGTGLSRPLNQTLASIMNRAADFEGVLKLAAEGGRSGPVRTGYRPGHRLYDNYISSGEHRFVGVDEIPVGGQANVEVWLITPAVYPGCLWDRRVIDVCEGTRVVGTLTVTRVLNESLRGSEEAYSSVWVEPAGLS